MAGVRKDTKNIGIAGYVLWLLGGFVPFIGFLLSLVGEIMFIVFYYMASKDLKNKKIFRYFLYAIILGVVAGIIVGGYLLAVIIPMLKSTLSATGISMSSILSSVVSSSSFIIVGIVLLALVIASYVFWVMASYELSRSTKNGLIFWGALLFIIPLVGAILYFIGLVTLKAK